MQRPGGITYHHASALGAPDENAFSSIVPHEIWVGSPRPRKESAASERIATATIRTVLAKISGSALGKIWVRMMYQWLAPSALARSTNARSRRVSTCERTIRPVPAHEVMPITRISTPSEGLRIRERTTISGSVGITRNQLSTASRIRSVQPPK